MFPWNYRTIGTLSFESPEAGFATSVTVAMR